MREASFYEKKENGMVRCTLCPHFCNIKEGKRGICRARKNEDGTLYTLTYGRPTGFSADPVEKKPLYHFLPGEKTFSFGTLGCNLSCEHCQNFEMSTGVPEAGGEISPESVVELAKKNGCSSIAFTYNEPTVFFEYMMDIAKAAGDLKLLIVSNGFINPEPLKELCKEIDAANIDLKGMEERFYKETCGAELGPVLESLKAIKKEGVHLEITNLLIPGKNDDESDVDPLISWVKENLGEETPVHFSAFHPMHKMLDVEATSPEKVEWACGLAKEKGLKYVYAGNIGSVRFKDTICPACGMKVIERDPLMNYIEDGKCACGHPIVGIFF